MLLFSQRMLEQQLLQINPREKAVLETVKATQLLVFWGNSCGRASHSCSACVHELQGGFREGKILVCWLAFPSSGSAFLSFQTKLYFSGWLVRNTQVHITKHLVLLKPTTTSGLTSSLTPPFLQGAGEAQTSPAGSQHKPLLVKSLSQSTLCSCPKACHFPPAGL